MQSNLYIPEEITIGFQKREDTYTGKLAYVIYKDEKGFLRKEHSWNSWRDKNIETLIVKNSPNNGFIINKGNQRCGYRFGSGRSVVRIYDERDFEFEINIDNLIGILMHSDVSKRDIAEECVYAWSGKDLILLPINSEQYRESCEYTKNQYKKVSAKDLIKGYTYSTKKSNQQLIYIGREEFFNINGWDILSNESKGNKHVFYNIATSEYEDTSVARLAESISEEVHPYYASLYVNFQNSIYNNLINGYSFKDINKKDLKERYFNTYRILDDKLQIIQFNKYYDNKTYNPNQQRYYSHIISNGKLSEEKQRYSNFMNIAPEIKELFQEEKNLEVDELYLRIKNANYQKLDNFMFNDKKLISTRKIGVKQCQI